MTTQVRTTTETRAPEHATTRTPLGSPHAGIAAVLATLSWAAFLFFWGITWGDGLGAQTLLGGLALAAAVLAAQMYLLRAHTPRFTLTHLKMGYLPYVVIIPAFVVVMNSVMEAFYRGVEGNLAVYVLGCLAIPALVFTPIHMLLRDSARRAGAYGE